MRPADLFDARYRVAADDSNGAAACLSRVELEVAPLDRRTLATYGGNRATLPTPTPISEYEGRPVEAPPPGIGAESAPR